MNREELERYINERYETEGEYMWVRYPNFAVFRHGENRKWFAVLMTIPKARLGLKSEELVDVVNLKCRLGEGATYREEAGVYPAYHMNKWHWISVCLDGSVSAERIRELLCISFDLTLGKRG